MIRRNIRLPSGERSWLLISQVEHARISAFLANRCVARFGRSAPGRELAPVRKELLAAIEHHDDGWQDLDARVCFDRKIGRPESFREVDLDCALDAWSRSIRAAESIGHLAPWVVSGHFLALLEHSEQALADPLARRWSDTYRSEQTTYLERWTGQNPLLHSTELASEALLWMQLFDVVSLWLCSACPGRGEEVDALPESYHFSEDGPLESIICCAGQPGRVTIDPWRLGVDELAVEASGHCVPAGKYHSPAELVQARRPHTVHWLLRAG